ncbi:MAG: alcohol dehydrogenase catalytic domain-containing protein, partial [Eudoraea sp.]|nr:alcohol dehydrogenase catalytic domain-containing protein [Eudoraea sp.]
MKAMVLSKIASLSENRQPLELADLPIPEPLVKEVLIKISVCGVCHTELDEIEGRTPPVELPMVLGHQAVGTITKLGPGCTQFKLGDRVGVAWIYAACGHCKYCTDGNENLCDQFQATGRDVNGGYAQYMVAKEKYTHLIPDFFSDKEAAPLLCAGAIGYRSIQLTDLNDGQSLGLTGFG